LTGFPGFATAGLAPGLLPLLAAAFAVTGAASLYSSDHLAFPD
jgi:hypothetical protein